MGLMPKPNLLGLRKSRNKSAAMAETNGILVSTMPVSGIHCDELVISSKKLEGMATLKHSAERTHLVPKNNLFDSLPLKYSGRERNGSFFANSLYDKFKQLYKDLDGEYQKEQWVPMSGTTRNTSFSDLCKAGKLSVNFNRNYAACVHKLSGRSQRSTKLAVGSCVNQGGIPGLLCIGVDQDATYSGTDEDTSDPLVPQELHWRSLSSSLEVISSSPDTRESQSAEDLSFMIYKSEQHSPVSVLEPLFEDAPPEPADAAAKPAKPPLRPQRISFEERTPVKRVKFHSDTITKTSISSKKHTSSELEYTRKILEASDLNLYQLALNRHCSTQMLDPVTYTKIKSQTLTPLETRLLFDHINEVLLNTYHHCCGFYQWTQLTRQHKQHLLTERNIFDQVVKIMEMNLIQIQHQVPEQKLVTDSMEKSGAWMDISRELEDMVMEIADEVAEELVEELMFEIWID